MESDPMYAQEKLNTALRGLLVPSAEARHATVMALHEFQIAFGHGKDIPEWATDAVERVQKAFASYKTIKDTAGRGTLQAWVDQATDEQLKALYDALLELQEEVSEEVGRRYPK